MKPKDWLVDYVPVEERIEAFYRDHPDGSLQSTIVTELTSDSRICIMAMAYRDPDDKRPGVGHSWLAIPGETTFTRGSELENAETSAWGRALAALGYEVKRGVASREEVANKQPAQGSEASPAPVPRTPEETEVLDALLAIPGMTRARLELLAEAAQVPKDRRATLGELRAMLTIAQRPTSEPTSWPDKGTAAWKALSAYERATAQAWHAKREKREAPMFDEKKRGPFCSVAGCMELAVGARVPPRPQGLVSLPCEEHFQPVHATLNEQLKKGHRDMARADVA